MSDGTGSSQSTSASPGVATGSLRLPISGPCGAVLKRQSSVRARLDAQQNLEEQWSKKLADSTARRRFVDLLGTINLFQGSSLQFREALAEALKPIKYKNRDVLWRQGEEGDWIGILLSGHIELQMTNQEFPTPWERHLSMVITGHVGPGTPVGDIAVLGICQHRQNTAITSEDSVVLKLTRAEFDEILMETGEQPEWFEDVALMQNWQVNPSSIGALRCFRSHGKELIEAISRRLEMHLYYKGDIIIREKEYGNEMFILQVGVLKVVKNGNVLRQLRGGNVVGEMAVLGSDKTRTATIMCETACLCLVLHGIIFQQVMSDHPAAMKEFNHLYISRLVAFDLPKVRGELSNRNQVFGNVHPVATQLNLGGGNSRVSRQFRQMPGHAILRPSTTKELGTSLPPPGRISRPTMTAIRRSDSGISPTKSAIAAEAEARAQSVREARRRSIGCKSVSSEALEPSRPPSSSHSDTDSALTNVSTPDIDKMELRPEVADQLTQRNSILGRGSLLVNDARKSLLLGTDKPVSSRRNSCWMDTDKPIQEDSSNMMDSLVPGRHRSLLESEISSGAFHGRLTIR